MSDRYYYCDDGKTVIGPINLQSLQALYDSGCIHWETPAMKEGDEEGWLDAASFVDVEKSTPPPLPPKPRPRKGTQTRRSQNKPPRDILRILSFWLVGGIIGLVILAGLIGKLAISQAEATPQHAEKTPIKSAKDPTTKTARKVQHKEGENLLKRYVPTFQECTFEPFDGDTNNSQQLQGNSWHAWGKVAVPNPDGASSLKDWYVGWNAATGKPFYIEVNEEKLPIIEPSPTPRKLSGQPSQPTGL